MAIKELLQDQVFFVCDIWLKDHKLNVDIDQDTEEGQCLNDAWNDWYNDDILLPVNQLVDEAITNGGYDELSDEDIYDICDSVLEPTTLLVQLMYHCCKTGYIKGFNDGVPLH